MRTPSVRSSAAHHRSMQMVLTLSDEVIDAVYCTTSLPRDEVSDVGKVRFRTAVYCAPKFEKNWWRTFSYSFAQTIVPPSTLFTLAQITTARVSARPGIFTSTSRMGGEGSLISEAFCFV